MIYRHRVTIKCGEYEFSETIFTRTKQEPDDFISSYYEVKKNSYGIHEDTLYNWYIPQHMNEEIKDLEELVS